MPARDDETAPAAPVDVGSTGEGSERRRELARHHRTPPALLVGIALGGAVGALLRYLLELALPAETGRFPSGTFVVNLSGCALLGFLLVVLDDRFAHRRLLRAVVGTGIIGAYTTFSTFSVETVLLVRADAVALAATYVVLSVVLGLATGLVGMAAARGLLQLGTRRRTES